MVALVRMKYDFFSIFKYYAMGQIVSHVNSSSLAQG